MSPLGAVRVRRAGIAVKKHMTNRLMEISGGGAATFPHTQAGKCLCNGFNLARLPEAQLAMWFCVPTDIIGPNRSRDLVERRCSEAAGGAVRHTLLCSPPQAESSISNDAQ